MIMLVLLMNSRSELDLTPSLLWVVNELADVELWRNFMLLSPLAAILEQDVDLLHTGDQAEGVVLRVPAAHVRP